MQITVVIISFLTIGISFQCLFLEKINLILLTYFLEVQLHQQSYKITTTLMERTSTTLCFVDVIAVG